MRNKVIKYAFLACAGMLWGCSDSNDDVEPVLPVSELTVNPEEVVFQQDGGESAFTISTNRGWAVQKGEGAWFNFNGETVGAGGEHSIGLVAAKYSGTEKRTSKITVQAGSIVQELDVTQFGSEPDMVLPEKEITVDYEPGKRTVVIHSNTTVELKPEASWIKMSEGYSLVSTQFVIDIEENTGAERRGSLSVKAGSKEEKITVIQKAWKAELSLSEELLYVNSQGVQGSVTLNSSGDWTLEFDGERPEWIVNVPLSGKKGTSVLNFVFTPNSTNDVRRCKMLIRCGDKELPFEIMQNKPTSRERDSLSLVSIYNQALSHGTMKWDFSKPMTEWQYVGLSELDDEWRVVAIHLESWKFSEIPAEIGELTELERLTFNACSSENVMIPDEIGQLKKLKDFSCLGKQCFQLPAAVSGCESLDNIFYQGSRDNYMGTFATLEGTVLPKEICDIEALKRLYFEGTDLSALPEELVNSNVENIVIELGSKWNTIPTFLGKMPKLKSLRIRNCDKVTGPIPSEIFEAPLLESCVLSKNAIEGTFPLAALSAPSLKELIIAANRLTGSLPKELVDSEIRILDVCMNQMGGPGILIDEAILLDPRFKNVYAWNGASQICMQQDGFGWSNCSTN